MSQSTSASAVCAGDYHTGPKSLIHGVFVGALILAWLLPAALITGAVWRYGVDIPFWDEWTISNFMLAAHQRGYPTFSELFAQHNEHRIFFPRLIFFYLGELTHWNIRTQLLFNIGIMASAMIPLFFLIRRRFSVLAVALFISAIANFLLFSPTQWENWIFSLQLALLMPSAALLWSLYLLDRTDFFWWRFGGGIVLTIIATYCFGGGMAQWAVLLPGVLFCARPNPRKMAVAGIVWIILGTGCIVGYFHDYHIVLDHPPLSYFLHHPWESAEFLSIFVGSAMRASPAGAGLLLTGRIVLCAAAATVLVILIRRRHLLSTYLPWILLIAYGMINGLLTLYGRSERGLGAAGASRYATLALPIYIGLLGGMALLASEAFQSHRTHLKSVAGGLVLFMLPACGIGLAWSWPYGLGQIDIQSDPRLTGRACVQLFYIVPKMDVLHARITFFSQDMLAKNLRALDQAGLLSCGLIASDDVTAIDGGKPFNAGLFGSIHRAGSTVTASGWADVRWEKSAADTVLLTTPDATGAERIFAIADNTRQARPRVATVLHAPALKQCGWSASFNVASVHAGAVISAWAYDTYSKKAYRLSGTWRIPAQ